MDLHPPGGPVRSLKEELRRYANVLIVIEFAGKGVLSACDSALK